MTPAVVTRRWPLLLLPPLLGFAGGCPAGSRPPWAGGPCCNVSCEATPGVRSTAGACGPGVEDCGPRHAETAVPGFHLLDRSCAQNDPCAPFYDPLHGRYHVFYQKHCAAPEGDVGSGPIWGHLVSDELLRWRRLPAALWNGPSAFDSKAIFTGSTTLIDGDPVVIYPGLDRRGTAAINICRATPSNRSDPDLVFWQKESAPVSATGGDGPSAAWLVGNGERRMIVGAGRRPMVYSDNASRMQRWHAVGLLPRAASGECPSFFALPPATPGSGPAPAGTPGWTHVHKVGCQNVPGMPPSWPGDCAAFGRYTSGPLASAGDWQPSPQGYVPMDRSQSWGGFTVLYAGKDFLDARHGRRVYYANVCVPPTRYARACTTVLGWAPL